MNGFLASIFTRITKFWTFRRSYPQAISDASDLKAKAERKRTGNKALFTPAQEELRAELGLRKTTNKHKSAKPMPPLKDRSSISARLSTRDLKRMKELGLIRDNPAKSKD